MHRVARSLSIGVFCASLFGRAAAGQSTNAPTTVTLTRLDCGTSPGLTDMSGSSDTYGMSGVKVPLVFSYYVIRHGDDYLVWDTGNAPTAGKNAPKQTLIELLAQLHVTPAQIKFVGISHYHGDHTGQASLLPNATLLIGQADWDAIAANKPGVNTTPFASWMSGTSRVEPQAGDKDVFGDGTVVMLNTPGHTPGHHSLLVRLKETGPVIISGDLAHFRENYAGNGVPPFNTSRAESLASLDRVKQIAANLKATVIIQHDGRDLDKLPAFPTAAK